MSNVGVQSGKNYHIIWTVQYLLSIGQDNEENARCKVVLCGFFQCYTYIKFNDSVFKKKILWLTLSFRKVKIFQSSILGLVSGTKLALALAQRLF